jgi:hypothetical protein
MNSESNLSVALRFAAKILILDIAMIGLAGLASFYALNFGATLFFLGIVIGGIGALRGGPTSIDTIYTNIILKRWHRPVRQSVDQRTYIIENSVATYSFENVMAFAGLIAIILGIILVISIK